MVVAVKLKRRPRKSGPPRVALLIETSLASGRDILRGIARFARERGPWSLHYEPRSLEQSLPRWLRDWEGDGLIARLQNRRLAEQVAAVGVPVVDVLGVAPEAGFPLVHVNDAAIARLAAEHLLERGIRSFGFLGIAGENWSERRRDALLARLRAASLPCLVLEIPRHASTGSTWDRVEEELAHWVERLPKPAGVMVSSDQLGPLFLAACRRAGADVPHEVAVIGVDNDEPLCEVCNPPLSSVRAGHELVGYEAARLLGRLMDGLPPPREPLLAQPQGIATRLSTESLALSDRQVIAALRVIREQATLGIGVDEVARRCGLSRSVLQRRFRRLLQRSVHEEILRARLERARVLIAETSLPLAEIAEQTGFRHQEYLGAVFKARFHQTPARFRRQYALPSGTPAAG